MSAATPTSGPWEIVDPPMGYVEIHGGIDGDADDSGRLRMISTHICDIIDNADEQGNAHLIAAAPDLKDGCNALLGLIQLVCARDDMPPAIRAALETSHRVTEARAALAKVEGHKP